MSKSNHVINSIKDSWKSSRSSCGCETNRGNSISPLLTLGVGRYLSFLCMKRTKYLIDILSKGELTMLCVTSYETRRLFRVFVWFRIIRSIIVRILIFVNRSQYSSVSLFIFMIVFLLDLFINDFFWLIRLGRCDTGFVGGARERPMYIYIDRTKVSLMSWWSFKANIKSRIGLNIPV